jgi:hypothetical protein
MNIDGAYGCSLQVHMANNTRGIFSMGKFRFSVGYSMQICAQKKRGVAEKEGLRVVQGSVA